MAAFRRHTLLPLNDCLTAPQAARPQLTRSSLRRCLQGHGISCLPEVEGDKATKKAFKASVIGCFHVGFADVRTKQGKLHFLVAIDRTSKFALAQLHERATTRIGANLLRALLLDRALPRARRAR